MTSNRTDEQLPRGEGRSFSLYCFLRLFPLICLGIIACDIPTEPPIVQQQWVVPLTENRMQVGELLPDGVTVIDGNFSIDVDALSESETLGNLCPLCVDGYSGPAPSFNGSIAGTQALPTDVQGATVVDGSLEILIQNGFDFDPLQGGGSIDVRILNGEGGGEVGSLSLSGSDALAPGTTVAGLVDLGPFTIGQSLHLSAEIDSPGGQQADIDLSDAISVTVNTNSLLVSSATLDVTGRSVAFQTVNLDVDGLDEVITDRIERGSVTLEISNPFGIAVAGSLDIGPTSKGYSISTESSSTVTLTYSGDELRSILDTPDASFDGSGTATGGTVTLTPDQELIIEPTLDVELTIG